MQRSITYLMMRANAVARVVNPATPLENARLSLLVMRGQLVRRAGSEAQRVIQLAKTRDNIKTLRRFGDDGIL